MISLNPTLAFINPEHERLCGKARALLAAEIERQRTEFERLSGEWERLPERRRAENHAWLRQHFLECRRPYEKILTDIMALCTARVIILPNA